MTTYYKHFKLGKWGAIIFYRKTHIMFSVRNYKPTEFRLLCQVRLLGAGFDFAIF